MTSTDSIYMNLILNNSNKTSDTSMIVNMSKSFNAIIDDISQFDMFINSVILTNTELAYRNFYKDISYNVSNFATNKTNYSISILDTGYNFNLNGNTNLLLTGFNESPTQPGYYQGVCCFLQYLSENSTLENPNVQGTGANSENYPRVYFNLHSIQQFLDFVNNAIQSCLAVHSTLNNSNVYFYYNSSSALYSCNMDIDFYNSTCFLYFNSFLQRMLDGFRVAYIGPTNINLVGYTGMAYKFLKNNIPTNLINNEYYVYNAEYSTINNISDILSLVITVDGNLSSVRSQVLSVINGNVASSTLQMSKILKVLDFVFDSSGAGINNSIIQFESINGMVYPLNLLSKADLSNIDMQFFVLTNDGSMYPIYLNADGSILLKICFKRKSK